MASENIYARLARIALPMALQAVLVQGVALADNIMVGSLGDTAIAGIVVANQVQFILNMLTTGVSAALVLLASQYYGKGDKPSMRSVVAIGFWLCALLGLALGVVCAVWPQALLGILTDKADTIVQGAVYLRAVAFSFPFMCATAVFVASMRCVENTRVSLYVSTVSLVVNITLNWALIYGRLGLPRLEVFGAALATVVSRLVEFALISLFVRFRDVRLELRPHHLVRFSRVLGVDFLKYGAPIITGDICWSLGGMAQTAILGRLEASAMSGNAIAQALFQVISVIVFSTSGAASVIIGKTIGEGRTKDVISYSRRFQVVFLCMGLVGSALIWFLRGPVISLYNVSPETRATAYQFLGVLAVTIIGTSYQACSLTGLVRAGGATRFVLFNDLIFIWLIVLPSAFIAAFWLHQPAVVVFACLKCDQILKCFVAVVKVNRFRWVKNLTREIAADAA